MTQQNETKHSEQYYYQHHQVEQPVKEIRQVKKSTSTHRDNNQTRMIGTRYGQYIQHTVRPTIYNNVTHLDHHREAQRHKESDKVTSHTAESDS